MAIKKTLDSSTSKYKVTFSLPVEALGPARDVRVVGDFNNWDWNSGIVMVQKKNKYQAETLLEGGRSYEFRYLADAQTWENDWKADDYRPVTFANVSNSVVEVPEVALEKTATKKAKKTKAKPQKEKDLTAIEGIGPKINQVLKDAGYGSFEALAKAKAEDIQEVLLAASSRYKMFNPSTWPQQAQLAANGQWDELDKLQKELMGGKAK